MRRFRKRFGVFLELKVVQRQNGRLVVSRRQISGMAAHERYWDGEGICVCEPVPEHELTTNLDRTLGGDNIELAPDEVPFGLIVANFDSLEARKAFEDVDVAIVELSHRSLHFPKWGREADVPVVLRTEYTLETRLRIAQCEELRIGKRARRMAWEINLERKQRSAIRQASGLHCNGVPTFHAYRHLNPNAMLYFDGRTANEQIVMDSVLQRRHRELNEGRPLRLAWSGRVNRMKGADHIPKIARALADRGIPFRFDVFGGGVLAEPIQRELRELRLDDSVRLHGFVDFREELTPWMQQNVDVWVCPHVQGDPSGSYMETFANGLPIVGYANEALSGLLGLVDAGETVPIGDAASLAGILARVHSDRGRLIEWSQTARQFAKKHTFDKSFERRMNHLDALLRLRDIRTGPLESYISEEPALRAGA